MKLTQILNETKMADFEKKYALKSREIGDSPTQSLAGLINLNGKEQFYIDNDDITYTDNNNIKTMKKDLFLKKFNDSVEYLHPKFVWDKPKLTVDGIIKIFINGKWCIPLIIRKYSPKGLAMPGGMIDSDDVNDAKYTFEKEMQEELNLTSFSNIELFKKFNVKEARGPVTTFVFTAISKQTPRAGDDAAAFEWVEVGENFELLSDFLKTNRNRFAMKHHFDILSAFAKGK